MPDLPSVVKETLGMLYNQAPIRSVDFYADMASGWWGASMQIQGTGGIGALLGVFNVIAQEVGLPSLGSFQPRFSIAGKLSGNGLPIAIGRLRHCCGDACWFCLTRKRAAEWHARH